MNNVPQGDAITEEQKRDDAIKAEAMQIIIDNQDQFDVRAVDKALTDLNSQMNRPIVDAQAIEEEDKPKRDSDLLEDILSGE